MVTVYTKNNCGQCMATTRLLTTKGVIFDTVSLDGEPDETVLSDLRMLGYSTAPIVVVNKCWHWSGFQYDQIQKLADTLRDQQPSPVFSDCELMK